MDVRRVLRVIVCLLTTAFLVAPPHDGTAAEGGRPHGASGLEVPCHADGGAFGL